jgi:hypothetical protein
MYYHPESGDLVRLVRVARCVKVGDQAGSWSGPGYLGTMIDGRNYLNHRLAWFYVTGRWPDAEIDHVNGDKTDNRLSNLREATPSENKRNRVTQVNNTSGFKGVYWNKAAGKWRAQIYDNGKSYHLGHFDIAEEAYTAYCNAAKLMHREFARLS